MMKSVVFVLSLACWVGLGDGAARAATNYVAHAGQTPSGNYTDWTSAASNIQDAINVADVGNTVLVGDGTYNLTNQITISGGITVRSLNGKSSTFVNGNYPAYSNRCFYLNNANAGVDGFTITNGGLISDGMLGGGVRVDAGLANLVDLNLGERLALLLLRGERQSTKQT